MTQSQYLRSRGWTPEDLVNWSKRGWILPFSHAYALELLFERNRIDAVPKAHLTDRQVRLLRKGIGYLLTRIVQAEAEPEFSAPSEDVKPVVLRIGKRMMVQKQVKVKQA